jgi:hypothetical protein
MFNEETGEVILHKVDEIMEKVAWYENEIYRFRQRQNELKQELRAMAQFSEGSKTARVQGDIYVAKIELPSKINWDQKKLKEIYDNYKLFMVDKIIEIKDYKVDMRSYKKIINTSYDRDIFNAMKNELMSANLGTIGSPRITIEKVNHE